MRVLRGNKDSVMAMLEAFVHDPLINWRLLNTVEADADNALSAANAGEPHMPGVLSPPACLHESSSHMQRHVRTPFSATGRVPSCNVPGDTMQLRPPS